ncbi:PA domain-containing protein, partial [Streptomyces anulatus]|uniref:PA domain-containing protein n=1 Tax=Streptomyces anulatus TaxID=1892 RepID=UPI0034338055
MRIKLRRNAIRLVTVAAAFSLPLALVAPAQADPGPNAAARQKLIDSVTAPAAKNHLRALQNIANANHGTRAAGTKGHDASRDYVAGKLRRAGYNVTLQPFEFGFFSENSTASLSQVSPDAKTYTPTPPDGSSVGEFATMTYSGSGDVTATVQNVDLTLPPSPAPGSTSGCEAADFTGFTRGNIALIQRGTCPFDTKARNAQAAGASAVVIFNEGQPGRTDTVQGRLSGPGVTIPVVGTNFAVGQD